MQGVFLFLGITQSGKTTKALELAHQWNAQGQPYLVLDCMPAKNFRRFPHARSVAEVLDKLYGTPPQNVIFTPRNEEDLEAVCRGVHAAGAETGARRTVLWDECSIHQSPNYIPPDVESAIRGWAHNDCAWLLVSQRPADLHGVIYACYPEVYCFRLERSVDVDRVVKELSLDGEKVRNLPQGGYVPYRRNRF